MNEDRKKEPPEKMLHEQVTAGENGTGCAQDDWPEPMADHAFTGIAGDFVRLIEPETESDPVALLMTFLVASGVLFGREAWCVADGSTHYPVEFLLIAGKTGAGGRKGTANSRTIPVMESVFPGFKHDRVLSGLSSAEGLIKAVSPEGKLDLPEDRCYLALLPEFASLLAVMTRQGNNLSSVLREAWDGERLRTLTRKDALDAENVNLSFIAQITPDELLNSLTATDRVNGFANRFLIVLVKRSKELPEGGGEPDLNSIITQLRCAVKAASGRGRIRRNEAAKEIWAHEYGKLTRDRGGLYGAFCARAEAHVLRLSLLYALLDSSGSIRPEHLQAALAVWEYCERSVAQVFRGVTSDLQGQKILDALITGPMTVSELHRILNNNKATDWIVAKMTALARAGRVIETTKTGTRKEAVLAWGLSGR